MQKIVFSSDALPAGLNDQARVRAWHDFLAGMDRSADVVRRLPDRPFSQDLMGVQFDGVSVMQMRGTVSEMKWASYTSAERSPDFFLCFNRSSTPMSFVQRGREVEFAQETTAFGSCTELGGARWQAANDVSFVVVPQAQLRELVANAEDLLGRPLPSRGAARLLRSYLGILPTPKEFADAPGLLAHVGETLADLVALALGAGRDATEIASMRGLRAARLREIVAAIREGFADPAFSVQSLARKLGMTPRYIQHLLQETDQSFTERVLELRLQRARAMLADPRHGHLKTGEIAAACGFNEIPYFNRCFRRRFGGTPTEFRG
jgi:AraC-like DNA-binding protein